MYIYKTLNTGNNSMMDKRQLTDTEISHVGGSRNLSHGLSHWCAPFCCLPSLPGTPLAVLVPHPQEDSHLVRDCTVFSSTADWTKGRYFSQTVPVRFLSLRFLK